MQRAGHRERREERWHASSASQSQTGLHAMPAYWLSLPALVLSLPPGRPVPTHSLLPEPQASSTEVTPGVLRFVRGTRPLNTGKTPNRRIGPTQDASSMFYHCISPRGWRPPALFSCCLRMKIIARKCRKPGKGNFQRPRVLGRESNGIEGPGELAIWKIVCRRTGWEKG